MNQRAWQVITDANAISLISHIHPDGDTLGSVLALYDVLKRMGKKVSLYNATPDMPRRFDFLPGIEDISDTFPPYYFDVAVTCDCGSLDRAVLKKGEFTLVNIDHHATNTMFGDINVVREDFCSVTMVVFEMLESCGVTISPEAAMCLYAGMAEDTGFFTYGNLTDKVFETLAKLTTLGADPSRIARKMRQELPLSSLRLRQHVLDSFELLENGTVAKSIITQSDLGRTGSHRDDTKNIINAVRELATVELAIMILEENDGSYKVSMRSKKEVDVASIAQTLGGGGHRRAAGFETQTHNPESICRAILNEMKKMKEN